PARARCSPRWSGPARAGRRPLRRRAGMARGAPGAHHRAGPAGRPRLGRAARSTRVIGQPLRRKEDARLVTGRGCYGDDVSLPGQAYAAFVRSPHAHAHIRSIDAREALKASGVIAVFTGADVDRDGLKPIPHKPVPTNPHEVPLKSPDGTAFYVAPHAALPADRVRFVGEPVAMVVAETAAAARDGAERVA